jgi:hypothetical protein
MRETTFTELRNHAKTFFGAVEEGETVRVYRNGRPVAGHRSGQNGDTGLEEAASDPALAGYSEPQRRGSGGPRREAMRVFFDTSATGGGYWASRI